MRAWRILGGNIYIRPREATYTHVRESTRALMRAHASCISRADGTQAVCRNRCRKILGKIAVATDRSLACYWGDLTDRETKPSNVSFYACWSNVLIILAPHRGCIDGASCRISFSQIRRDCEALLSAYSALLFVLLCSAVSSYKYTHTLCLRFASGGDFGSTVMLKSTQKSLSGVL